MKPTVRRYNHDFDFGKVGQFLIKTYRTSGEHINWLQPRWEYMHYHPLIRDVDLGSIGVWEAGGEIVGVVHPEHIPGEAYFQIDPAYTESKIDLKREMLAFAEESICVSGNGGTFLFLYISDWDREFQKCAAEKGYEKQDKGALGQAGFMPLTQFVIPKRFPAITVPDGFHLQSLEDDNDLEKLHRVLWRGFNHGDNPPDEGIEERRFMQSAPNYKKNLNIVVKAPNHEFVSYCGMWYEPTHRVAMVEPVATDPDYRRMGLASAAVLEGIRRCGRLGATVAFVGSGQPLYLSIGFKPIYSCSVWKREWI